MEQKPEEPEQENLDQQIDAEYEAELEVADHQLEEMAKPAKPSWRSTAWLLLRLGITFGLFAFLYYRIDWAEMYRLATGTEWGWLICALVAYGMTTALGIWRWHLLLHESGLAVSLGRTAQLTFVGLFANSFLPGMMGGDLVRAYFVAKEAPQAKATAIMSIVMERLLGTVAMIVVSTTLILNRFEALTSEVYTKVAVYVYFGLCICVVCVFMLGLWKNVGRYIPFWKRLPFHEALREAGRAYRFFLTHPVCLCGGLLLSVAAHFCLMATFYFVGRALMPDADFWNLAAALPLIGMVSALPLTIGGFGLREVASEHFLIFAGMSAEQSVALSLLGTGVIYVWNLMGGIAYWQYQKDRKREREQASSDSPSEDG